MERTSNGYNRANSEIRNKYKDKIRVFKFSEQLTQFLKSIALCYVKGDGGEGNDDKMYWLEASSQLFPDNQEYIFGSKERKIYKLKARRDTTEGWRITKFVQEKILKALNMTVPDDYEGFHVVCKYGQGYGVGVHSDSDYNSKVNTIISMNALGESIFTIELDKQKLDIPLKEGYVVTFDRSIRHSAGPSLTKTRINITRFAEKHKNNIFIHPNWYVSPGDGDKEKGGEV